VDNGHHHNEILDFKTDINLVTGAQVMTAGKVILVYKVTAMNSRLGNCRLLDWIAIWSGI